MVIQPIVDTRLLRIQRYKPCVYVCVPHKRFLIIITLGMETASDMGIYHVLIILTLTFIQGKSDLNHENNKCLIISETFQAMPIKFALEIVRLKVSMTIASPMTLTCIQGHKCVSNLTTFLTCNVSDNI